MTRYENGFLNKCAEAGLTPLQSTRLYLMQKQALSNTALGGIGAGVGALVGGGIGGLRRKKKIVGYNDKGRPIYENEKGHKFSIDPVRSAIGALIGGALAGGAGYGLGKWNERSIMSGDYGNTNIALSRLFGRVDSEGADVLRNARKSAFEQFKKRFGYDTPKEYRAAMAKAKSTGNKNEYNDLVQRQHGGWFTKKYDQTPEEYLKYRTRTNARGLPFNGGSIKSDPPISHARGSHAHDERNRGNTDSKWR